MIKWEEREKKRNLDQKSFKESNFFNSIPGLLYLRILDIVHQIRHYFNPFPRNKLRSSALEIESKDIGAKWSTTPLPIKSIQ